MLRSRPPPDHSDEVEAVFTHTVPTHSRPAEHGRRSSHSVAKHNPPKHALGRQSRFDWHRAVTHTPSKQIFETSQSELQLQRPIPGAGHRLPSRGHESGKHTAPTQLRSSAVPATPSSPRQAALFRHSAAMHHPSKHAPVRPQSASAVHLRSRHLPLTHVWPSAHGRAKTSQACPPADGLLDAEPWLAQAPAPRSIAKNSGLIFPMPTDGTPATGAWGGSKLVFDQHARGRDILGESRRRRGI
jgi:hypothetical protein